MTNLTLKKLSQVLELSVSTVSRALKNHPDISPQTRKKVVELAHALDYEPDANAVHLRTKSTKLLGLMVPSISNYFYESFIGAVEVESRKRGYSVMILQSGDDPAIESENLRLFRQNRISGLFACITPFTEDLSHFIKMRELKIPVFFFDKVPVDDRFPKVCMADELAGQLAAETIHRAHCQNVLAIFGNIQLSITQKRMKTFHHYCKEKEITFSVVHALSSTEANEFVHQYLQQEKKPDTIFCMSDEILIGVMKALQELEIRHPHDIRIIAISNGYIPKLFYPEITYVETSGPKLGKLAFSQMMNSIDGIPIESEITTEALLVAGGSL